MKSRGKSAALHFLVLIVSRFQLFQSFNCFKVSIVSRFQVSIVSKFQQSVMRQEEEANIFSYILNTQFYYY